MNSIAKVKNVTFKETSTWKSFMNEGVVHILKAGGSDTVVQQFKDLIETERFNGLSISKRLSLILTGGGVGNYKGARGRVKGGPPYLPFTFLKAPPPLFPRFIK